MAVQSITVQKGSVTRQIQASAVKIYARKGWKQLGGETSEAVSTPIATKKNVVEPVGPVGEGADTDEQASDSNSGSPFLPVGEGSPDETSESTNLGESTETPSEIDALREEYKILSGKDAGKKWNVNRLKTEISKLSPQ